MRSVEGFYTNLAGLNSKIILRYIKYVIILIGAFYLGLKNFLIFHMSVEIACIIIASTMTVISINTHNVTNDNRIIFLGVAYGFIAFFDLIHTFSFKGMSIFASDSANLPTQLWIAARYLEGISLLIISIFPNRRFRFRRVFPIYLGISIFLLLSIFAWDIFPNCYCEETGLTMFKITSEYIICAILLIGMFYVAKNNCGNHKKVTTLIFLSFLTTLISEICFTWYISLYDTVMIIGHMFKLFSFHLVYISLIETSLREPYYKLNEINKILNARNNELEILIEQLEIECEKRKQIEEENRRKKEILGTILETSPNGVLVIGQNREVIKTNRRFIEMWGFSYEELMEMDSDKVFDTMKKHLINFYEIEDKLSEDCYRHNSFICYLQLIDGRTIEVTTSPFIDKEVIIGKFHLFRDITERMTIVDLQKKIEIRQALLEKAREYDEIKSVFFSTVSHEFKTPLNIILSSIQMIERICNKETHNCNPNKYIKMMRQNCNRLLKLVNNIVDITRIDSGFMKINLRNENIVSVIEDITLSVAEYARSLGISLIFDTDIEEKIVACDAEKLERIILNLLSNALKFTGEGGSINVDIKEKNDNIIIRVKDTGIGIPEDMLEIIFDRFRQVDTSLRRKKEGSGIGLSIVKSMVELHGGKISVNSKLGKGSEFIIELPSYQIDNANECKELAMTREVNIERINIEFSDIYM